MKQKNNQIIIKCLLTLVLVIAIGDNLYSQQTSPTALICNSGWKKIAWTVSPAMQYTPYMPVASDILKYERECTRDDFYVFAEDGGYQLLNGINKCGAGEGDLISSGRWAFLRTDNRIFNMVPGGKGGILQKQIELATDKMVWVTTQVKNGVKYTFTETFIPL